MIDDRIESIDEEYDINENIRDRLLLALEEDLPSQIRKLFSELHPADQAQFLSNRSSDDREKIISILKGEAEDGSDSCINPEMLVELEGSMRAEVIDLMGINTLSKAISELAIDDAVDILSDLDREARNDILNTLSTDKREILEESLSYPEGSIGRLVVNKVFISVPQTLTAGDVLKYLKEQESLPDDFLDIVVTDEEFKPVAKVSIGQLIKKPRSTPILEVNPKDNEIKLFKASEDQGEVARVFTKYDVSSVAIVDEKGILIGVVSTRDIIDIIEEEAEEDILHLNRLPDDDIYTHPIAAARNRLPWLLTSLFTTSISVFIINSFSVTVEKVVLLAALMPVLGAIGGVAGSQTLTVFVRNLATKEINNRNAAKIIFKEIFISLLNGSFLGVMGSIALFFYSDHNLFLSLIFGVTIAFALTLAGLTGTMIPYILNKLKFDPAITSGVFLQTTIDALSYIVFLGLATQFLSVIVIS